MEELLEVHNLSVRFYNRGRWVYPVQKISFQLKKGETIAIVGESGSGKTMLVTAILGLLGNQLAAEVEGDIFFQGKNLVHCHQKERQNILGNEMFLVVQDAMNALNPTMQCGKQITDILCVKKGLHKKEAKKEALELLRTTLIDHPEQVFKQYPYQLSGGMQQRVLMCIALACKPRLLIADEPTTALDNLSSKTVLHTLVNQQKVPDKGLLLVSHDLKFVADYADRMMVMYAGECMEIGRKEEIMGSAFHPYTRGLLLSGQYDFTHKNKKLYTIDGNPPSVLCESKGCPFVTRCKYAMQVCTDEKPKITNLTKTHQAACWLTDERAAGKVKRKAGEDSCRNAVYWK